MKYNKGRHKNVPIVILGRERGGRCATMWAHTSGHWEAKDGYFNNTPNTFNTLVRETWEELGIPAIVNAIGPQRRPDGHNKSTPIWITHVPSGVSRRDFIPNYEILQMDFIRLDDLIVKSTMHYDKHGNSKMTKKKPYVKILTIDNRSVKVCLYTLITIAILHGRKKL